MYNMFVNNFRGEYNMKNIKYFKYMNTKYFNVFLKEYGYKLDDVKGFSFIGKKQYRGNVLKIYFIHFNDGEKEYFKVAYFKSFNECKQSSLGFNGNKLLSWYNDANIRKYRLNLD